MQWTVHLASSACAVMILVGGTLQAAPDVSEIYGKLPLSFEVNKGQIDGAVRFLSRGQGYTVFLTPAEAVLSLGSHETTVVRMHLVGGNGDPRMIGVSPQPTTSNYFLGNDPRHWHTDVLHYARVRAEGVYPGVDLIYRGNRGSRRQLEYDFVIAPGADPARIRLAFQGAEAITLGAQGELILRTANGDLVQHAPLVYQEAGKRRQRVEGRYVLLASREVSFKVGRYDRSRPLVIDPVLSYSTFLGGSMSDAAFAIAVDGAGSAYVTGNTRSATFPGVTGSSIQPANAGPNDVFVTKINPAGNAILYSTFLGGISRDTAAGIAVDGAGNAYVTGETVSATFPGVNGSSIQPAPSGSGEAFVTKINPAGNTIVYSTFLGGGSSDRGNGIAVDGAGSAYVVGTTSSSSFPGANGSPIQPVHGGFQDAFVTKINPAGNAIVYSTFLGGSSFDHGEGIAADLAGNAYVTGDTASTTFPGVSGSSIQPTKKANEDVFVTKIDPAGTATLYSTFLGSDGSDFGRGIAIDAAGNAFLTGDGMMTMTDPLGLDSFVMKINAAGTAILYRILLGGNGIENSHAVAVDGAGNAHVTGETTNSTTFTGISAGSIQPVYGGGFSDAFVTTIGPTGAVLDSTFLGGSGSDRGRGIAVDAARNVYVTGETSSTTFPGVSAGSIQPANAGLEDAFVTKISSTDIVNDLEIPTLSQWGLILMALLLAATGLVGMRKTWRRA